MQILTPQQLDAAVEILSGGGVVVYPTETSYALGCDATNEVAIIKVFTIKGRPEGKGTPIILPNNVDPGDYISMSARARSLTQKYWPGPLNIISVRNPNSPISQRCETNGTQAVRQSSHPVASQLALILGKPLVATSANRSGEMQIYRPDEVEKEFTTELPDAILDVGNLPVVPASTTVLVDGDEIRLIRLGEIIV